MGLIFRARDLSVLSAAAACLVTACSTVSGGGALVASSAPTMVATPNCAPTPTATAVEVAGSPSPTGLPAAGAVIPDGPVTVTQADDGDTIQLAVGQQVTVVLATPSRMWPSRMWDQPSAQGCGVIRVSASGGYPGSTSARAVFRAIAQGSAKLTSSTDMTCEHQATVCPAAEENWTVLVVVV